MPTLPADYQLKDFQRSDPVVWIRMAPESELGPLASVDLTDEACKRYLGGGKSMKLKSFGHDELGVHFLLTRHGTTVHTDPAYARYTHQLVLRNDGNRLRGLPAYDQDPFRHPMLLPGTMYCLDTHSPHQGIEDPRFPQQSRAVGIKVVLAADRDEPMNYEQAWEVLRTWLGRQMSEVDYDPGKYAAPKWKDTTAKAKQKAGKQ